MSLTMDRGTETYDDDIPILQPADYVGEVTRLTKDAINAIQRIDDHCDGIDSARKSAAIRQVKAIEALAMTLAEAS